jgi:hypothetical protein
MNNSFEKSLLEAPKTAPGPVASCKFGNRIPVWGSETLKTSPAKKKINVPPPGFFQNLNHTCNLLQCLSTYAITSWCNSVKHSSLYQDIIELSHNGVSIITTQNLLYVWNCTQTISRAIRTCLVIFTKKLKKKRAYSLLAMT